MARTTQSSATWAGVSSSCESRLFSVTPVSVLVSQGRLRSRRGHSR
jgi:hypothetical protein